MGCFINSYIKPALKGEVSMSVSELAEGLKKKVASLGIVNPSVKPSVCQLPVEGSLLVRCHHTKAVPVYGESVAA